MKENKTIKITLDELNEAYKLAKIEGEKVNKAVITVYLSRNPLVLRNILVQYNEDSANFDIVLKLNFEFFYEVGRKGSWICISNVEVIDIDNG